MTVSMYSGGFTGLWSSVLKAGKGEAVTSLDGWDTVRTKEFVLIPEGCATTAEGVAAVEANAPPEQQGVPEQERRHFTFHPAVEEKWKPLEEHPVPFSIDGTNANSAAVHVKVLPQHVQLVVPSSRSDL